MPPKPDYYAADSARASQDQTVALYYHLRPFAVLAALVVDEPRTVLDPGAGTGDFARGLLLAADRVDAVDVTLAMIEQGRLLEHGDDSRQRWTHGRAKEAPLDPPYTLLTAGAACTGWTGLSSCVGSRTAIAERMGRHR